MLRPTAIAVIVVLVSSVATVGAADDQAANASILLPTIATVATSMPLGEDADAVLARREIARVARRLLLAGLYAGLASLQAYDGYSTSEALKRGGREANPLMAGIVGNRPVLWTIKAAAAAVPIVLAERMWRTNRVHAIVMMVLVNGVGAAVAVNNARALRRQR